MFNVVCVVAFHPNSGNKRAKPKISANLSTFMPFCPHSCQFVRIVALSILLGPFPIRCNKREKVKRRSKINTKKKRQSRVRIQFLAARATIISDETDEERTCLLGSGAGRSPIDRVIGGLRERKGNLLTFHLRAIVSKIMDKRPLFHVNNGGSRLP